jgi:hypothetical protein
VTTPLIKIIDDAIVTRANAYAHTGRCFPSSRFKQRKASCDRTEDRRIASVSRTSMRLQIVDSCRCACENAATIPTMRLAIVRCLIGSKCPDERLYTKKVQIAVARRSVTGRVIVAKLRMSRACAATRLFA